MESKILIHPGEFIKEELEAREWSQGDLAHILGCPEQAITAIIDGKRGITSDMAKSLSLAFEVSPQLFTNLQQAYDFAVATLIPASSAMIFSMILASPSMISSAIMIALGEQAEKIKKNSI